MSALSFLRFCDWRSGPQDKFDYGGMEDPCSIRSNFVRSKTRKQQKPHVNKKGGGPGQAASNCPR